MSNDNETKVDTLPEVERLKRALTDALMLIDDLVPNLYDPGEESEYESRAVLEAQIKEVQEVGDAAIGGDHRQLVPSTLDIFGVHVAVFRDRHTGAPVVQVDTEDVVENEDGPRMRLNLNDHTYHDNAGWTAAECRECEGDNPDHDLLSEDRYRRLWFKRNSDEEYAAVCVGTTDAIADYVAIQVMSARPVTPKEGVRIEESLRTRGVAIVDGVGIFDIREMGEG